MVRSMTRSISAWGKANEAHPHPAPDIFARWAEITVSGRGGSIKGKREILTFGWRHGPGGIPDRESPGGWI